MKKFSLIAGFLALSAAAFAAGPISLQPTEQDLVLQMAPLKSSAEPEIVILAERLETGLSRYASINDYKAIFVKKEIDKSGALGPEEKIFLKFVKPFKIFLSWKNTRKKGLQVFYERGRHDGKLVIHKPGLIMGLAPVIFLPQDSPWVREGSASYNIEDAGIGTFLKDFSRAVIRGAREKKLKVRKLETPVEKAEAFEVTFPESQKNEDYFAYRIIVTFDTDSRLPTRMELFDWKDSAIGSYAYESLAVDVGETQDAEFKKSINRHLYNVYSHKD